MLSSSQFHMLGTQKFGMFAKEGELTLSKRSILHVDAQIERGALSLPVPPFWDSPESVSRTDMLSGSC